MKGKRHPIVCHRLTHQLWTNQDLPGHPMTPGDQPAGMDCSALRSVRVLLSLRERIPFKKDPSFRISDDAADHFTVEEFGQPTGLRIDR
ncbi:MAG: hypothetical protein FJY85_22960, partial [Deltaproteobacteria bacterium]|nr:hypothetical protein [Deltaproteobacteria bacterium]